MPKAHFEVDHEKLKSDIKFQIERVGRNIKRDKSKTLKIHLFTGFASAATTALIGLSKYYDSYEDEFQVAALLVSAFLTIVLSWDKLFEHKKVWLISARLRRKFFELREDFEHAEKTKTLTSELLKDFYSRYKLILSSGDKEWDALRAR